MPKKPSKTPIARLQELVSIYHSSPDTAAGIHPHRARSNPHISKGEGQGRGFYAFTDPARAEQFMTGTVLGGIKNELFPNITVRQGSKGARVYEAKVARKHLLPDAELSYDILKPMLLKHADRIKAAIAKANEQIPGGLPSSQLLDRKKGARQSWPHRIADYDIKDVEGELTPSVKWGIPQSKRKLIAPLPETELDATTNSAQLLGPILKAIKAHDPELMDLMLEETISKGGAVRSRVGSNLRLINEFHEGDKFVPYKPGRK